MKILILLSLFLIGECFASFYVAESKLNSCSGRTAYLESSDCESLEKEKCLKLDSAECGVYAVKEITEDDLSKPIRQKSEATVCVQGHETDENGELVSPEIPTCFEAMAKLTCSNDEKFINEDYTEAYCSKITGYEQKFLREEVVVNATLKAQKDAEKAQKEAMEKAMAMAAKAQECGKTTQQLLLVRNASKSLTTTQVKEMVALYAPVKSLLDTGSLNSAVEEIQAVEADGLLITEADKVALINHINACK